MNSWEFLNGRTEPIANFLPVFLPQQTCYSDILPMWQTALQSPPQNDLPQFTNIDSNLCLPILPVGVVCWHWRSFWPVAETSAFRSRAQLLMPSLFFVFNFVFSTKERNSIFPLEVLQVLASDSCFWCSVCRVNMPWHATTFSFFPPISLFWKYIWSSVALKPYLYKLSYTCPPKRKESFQLTSGECKP